MDQAQLSRYKVLELRQICKDRGMRRYSHLRKGELIQAIIDNQAYVPFNPVQPPQPQPQPQPPPQVQPQVQPQPPQEEQVLQLRNELAHLSNLIQTMNNQTDNLMQVIQIIQLIVYASIIVYKTIKHIYQKS